MWTSQVCSDASIDQLKGRSPESCLSWHPEGCPKHDLFTLEYSKCARLLIISVLMLKLSYKY